MRAQHFFTGDLRFDDERTTAARGFDSVESHDLALIERWNAVVGEHDLVWILGGFLGAGGARGPEPYVSGLNGVKHFLAGPGDRLWAGYNRPPREQDALIGEWTAAGFKTVIDGSAMTTYRGRPVRVPLRMGLGVDLSPLPYDGFLETLGGGTHYDAYAPWRPKRAKPVSVTPWLVHGAPTPDVMGRYQVSVASGLWRFEPVPAEVVAGLIESSSPSPSVDSTS